MQLHKKVKKVINILTRLQDEVNRTSDPILKNKSNLLRYRKFNDLRAVKLDK